MRSAFPLFIALLIFGCNAEEDPRSVEFKERIAKLQEDSAAVKPVLDSLRARSLYRDSLMMVEVNRPTEKDRSRDSLELAKMKQARHAMYAERFSSKWQIITTGSFHGEEVPKDLADYEWFGIGTKDNNTLLLPVRLKFRKDFDVMVDLGTTDSTGIHVIPDPLRNTELFISGPRIEEGPVDVWNVSRKLMYPGFSFYAGVDLGYNIIAEGISDLNENRGENVIHDYMISVVWFDKQLGELQRQIIDGSSYLDESPFYLLFCGDLDKDGIPDLILRNAYHYNTVESLGLFLSSQAEPGKRLKHVAQFFAVGC